jgi:porin
MSGPETSWQEVLTVAALGLAAGYLVIRAWRNTRRGRSGASCGACPAGENGCGGAGASPRGSRIRSRAGRALIVALLAGAVPTSVVADTTTILDSPSTPWWARDHASGDPGGRRTSLDERGVALEALYTGEVFSNLHGGLDSSHATEYRGNFDLTLVLDTEALGLWSGGSWVVYLQNGHGEGISEEYVGDVQILSNIDADDFTQVSEYWLQQRLFGDAARLKLGKQDANADFCALDGAGDFINSSFGIVPNVPIPTFPDPGLGVAVFLEPAAWLGLGMGVYDGGPNGGTSGFDTAFDGEGGTFGITELTLRTPALPGIREPGVYRIGGWLNTENVDEITGDPGPHTFSGNHGLYVIFDQLLFEEGPGDTDSQGMAAFGQFSWAPGDRNELERYLGAGVIYTGAIRGRDLDMLGLGVAHAVFSDRVRDLDGTTHETVIELFYRAQLTPWLALEPDLQLIVNPGGNGDDSLVLGLRFAIDL